jgi:hypothetical protein
MIKRAVFLAVLGAWGSTGWAQESVNWTIDPSRSEVTVEVEADLGSSTLSDADNTSLQGSLTSLLGEYAYPFDTARVTTLNAQTTSDLAFSLTVSFFGGVVASTQNLAFGIPGPNNTGVAGPGGAVDAAGVFVQTDNLIETDGTLNYNGVGILGASIGSGSVDLGDQPPTSAGFTVTLAQSPGLLTLTVPVNFTGSQELNGVATSFTTTGTITATAVSDSTGWKASGGGSWTSASNWSGGVPGAADGRRVYFGPVNTSPALVLNVGGSVDILRIKSPQAYTLALTANLNADRVEVADGIHAVNGTVVGSGGSGQDVVFDIGSTGVLQVTTVRADGLGSLVKAGPGILTINSFDVGNLVLQEGLIRGHGPADLISISPGAQLNILLGTLSTLPSELAEVAALTASGYAGGSWAGPGIISTLLAPQQGVGYVVETTANPRLLVRVTTNGDADLSGAVGFSDLLSLAQNYEQPGAKFWFSGDFNFDGLVNFTDLLTLAQNYTGGSVVDDWAAARSVVPEPTTAALAAGAMVTLLRRGVRRK